MRVLSWAYSEGTKSEDIFFNGHYPWLLLLKANSFGLPDWKRDYTVDGPPSNIGRKFYRKSSFLLVNDIRKQTTMSRSGIFIYSYEHPSYADASVFFQGQLLPVLSLDNYVGWQLEGKDWELAGPGPNPH
uniref:Uncharacterized protein n=1 Tax=Sphaerodactylus townsendi TaxID=933632 RepID=A0ACB8ESM4_9SAUR